MTNQIPLSQPSFENNKSIESSTIQPTNIPMQIQPPIQAQPPIQSPRNIQTPRQVVSTPESQSEERYKACMASLSGVWHEDSTILVRITRSVNVPMKSAAYKISFENKLSDATLHIIGLELLPYDSKGNFIIYNSCQYFN